MLPESFWDKVDKTPSCWLWIGAINSKGYGSLRVKQRTYTPHRLAYVDAVGPVPDGLCLDHLCRVRTCVNPSHLEPVTWGDNTRRGQGPAGLNYQKTHCKNGHQFDAANTSVRLDGRPWRACRACARAATTRYKLRKKAQAYP